MTAREGKTPKRTREEMSGAVKHQGPRGSARSGSSATSPRGPGRLHVGHLAARLPLSRVLQPQELQRVSSSPVGRPSDLISRSANMGGEEERLTETSGTWRDFFQKLYCQQQYKNKKLYLQNYGRLILPSLVSLLT